MTILSAQSIRARAIFTPHSERTRCPRTGTTYGLGPMGYDVRIAEHLVMHRRSGPVRLGGPEYRVVRAVSFALASTMEHFSMPTDVGGFVHDKSTLARRGLAVQNTVIEPGWRGHLTLELTCHGNETIELHPGDPIAQIVLHLLDAPTESPYAGRYQDQQAGPQPARYLGEGERP